MSTRILKPVKLLAVFCNTHCLQKKKKENSVLSGLAHRYLWLQSKCNRNIYLYEHLVCFRICPFSTDNTNGAGKTCIKCSSCVWNSFCVSNIRTLWWTGIPHGELLRWFIWEQFQLHYISDCFFLLQCSLIFKA